MATTLSGRTPALRVIAYWLVAYSDGHYFGTIPEPGVHCMACQSLLDYDYVSPSFRIRRVHPISDVGGRDVVSAAFRDFCRQPAYADVNFVPLDARRGIYEMRPTRVVHVDQAESRPDFSDLCPKCGQFECITIGRGLFLEEAEKPLADGFYRTDLNFACVAGKWPLTIIGTKTAAKLKAAGFKHFYTRPIPYLNPYWRGPRAMTEDRRYHAEHMARARRALQGM